MDKSVLSSPEASSPVLGFTQLPMQWPRRTFSLGVTRPEREDDLLTLSSCKVKNTRRYTPLPHTPTMPTWENYVIRIYEACRESIQPFWISREPVTWPWCNLAASQRRPYCASVNSYSSVGLVSRQWDAVDWACVLCERRIHKSHFQRRF